MTATDRRIVRAFFALVAVVYFASYPYLQAINNPNENTRTYLVMALVDHGTWRLDPVVQRFGWTNDMAKVPDAGGTHFAAVKGPATTYLGVPVYAVEKAVLRLFGRRPPDATSSAADAAEWLRTTTIVLELFVSHLPCFLFSIWLERRLRRFSRDVVLRLSTVAAVALGTNYLAYAFVYVSHSQAAAAAFVGLDLVAGARLRSRGDPRRATWGTALLAGLAIGLVTLLEYQGAFLSIVLGVYALSIFRAPRTFAAFAAGAGVNVVLLGVFQWASFANPLTPGHRYMDTEAFRALQRQGWFGLTLPHLDAMRGLLFDGGYGLFGTSPFLWLALPGAVATFWLGRRLVGRAAREHRIEIGVAIVAVVPFFLAVCSAVMWRGGWTIGPRYLAPIVVLVALVALAGGEIVARAHRRARPWVRALFGGLALASIVQCGVVGILVSTLPESVERPLVQIVVPFLRLAIVPHHALEIVGVRASWPIYVAIAGAIAAGALSLAASAESSRRSTALRIAAALVVATLALIPAARLPKDVPDAGPDVRALFYEKWEPTGRDAIARARSRAASDPCAFRDVAALERILGRGREATVAERRAAACDH